MKTLAVGAWLVVLVAGGTTASCGGDGFAEQPGTQDAGAGSDASDDAKQDEAAPDAPVADQEVPTCDIQTTLAECDDCINTKCLAECQKCANNPACQDIYNCVIANCVTEAGTPDPVCAEDCVKAHPAGFSAFGAFWLGLSPGCVPSKCGSECPW